MEQDNKGIIREIYGKKDLAEYGIFQGGYINFGYWKDISLESITVADRIRASEALYDLIFQELSVSNKDRVLEVGCGRGLGCRRLLEKANPAEIIGLDATREQVERATRLHADLIRKHKALSFREGVAEKLPFESSLFKFVYSVEAAQHFSSIPEFIKEAWRVLQRDGKLAVTTLFAESDEASVPLAELIPTVKQNFDRFMPIKHFERLLAERGFTRIVVKNIGAHVFEGFDRWMDQYLKVSDWGRNILRAFQQQLLGYYVVTGEKN